MKITNNHKFIWNYLHQNTSFSDFAISGLMGNLEAESNCEALRLQGDFSADRSNSKTFSANVDAGNTESFLSGKYGWGLAQWTHPDRCRKLLSFCKARGKSIGDLESQCSFMLKEMRDEFPNTWKTLSQHDVSIYGAAYIVCTDYERPAINNVTTRTDCGQEIYDALRNEPITDAPDDKSKESKKTEIIDFLYKVISLVEEM